MVVVHPYSCKNEVYQAFSLHLLNIGNSIVFCAVYDMF